MQVLVVVVLMLIALPGTLIAQGTGTVFVVDSGAGPAGAGILYSVDLSTGFRQIVSDFNTFVPAAEVREPLSVEIEPSGQFLVLDIDRRKLFRVDPNNGQRTVLSDFTAAPMGRAPSGMALDSQGKILVADQNGSGTTTSRGLLFQVDQMTGVRSTLSDFSNAAQGDLGSDPFGVSIDAVGNILVVDRNAGMGQRGALFRVDKVSGVRQLISDFGNASQGPLGQDPRGIAIERSGNIIVADTLGGLMFRVNPNTGQRTIITDFSNSAQGPAGFGPTGIVVMPNGNVLVAVQQKSATGNASTNQGLLFSVHPTTGQRAVVSDFGNMDQGPLGVTPMDVAVLASDTTPPVLTLPSDITVEATSSSGAVVNFVVTAQDDVDGAVTPTCTRQPNTIFAIQTTNVSCSATDNSGNTSSGSFNVRVQDTTAPDTAITSARDGDGVAVPAGGMTLSSAMEFTFSGSDAVGVTGFRCNLDSNSPIACGTAGYSGLVTGSHTFQVRAMDGAGNTDATPAAFQWTILTPAQAAANLVQFISGLDLAAGVRQSLAAPLKNVADVLTDENPRNDVSACGKLNAFGNEVRAKLNSGAISASQAEMLLGRAQAIQRALGCS